MQVIRHFLLLCFSFASLQIAANDLGAIAGKSQSAPDFPINLSKQARSLSDLHGKVVLVDFWASWCKPCRHSFPWMNAMQEKYGKDGLQIIAVNLDSEKQLAHDFLAQVPASMPIVFDPLGEIASQYQLLGMPNSYLIDQKGNIRFVHKGFFAARTGQYEQEINHLLAELE